ncbi:hypothetical protein [Vreelandella olivaria]|uniref:hypothetical protein n=1 Tax=Vreelandella olivaria TaxID=390919 RepID=UPI00201EE2AA|nr:hypothetical protein [Halomonas olivaria]
MMSSIRNSRLGVLLLSGMLVLGTLALAGCGDSSPPNEEAEPEPEQPMSQGPMSNEDAGEAPSDEL